MYGIICYSYMKLTSCVLFKYTGQPGDTTCSYNDKQWCIATHGQPHSFKPYFIAIHSFSHFLSCLCHVSYGYVIRSVDIHVKQIKWVYCYHTFSAGKIITILDITYRNISHGVFSYHNQIIHTVVWLYINDLSFLYCNHKATLTIIHPKCWFVYCR